MALWDFVEKRMAELGITRNDLEDNHDIAYATIQRIRAGKPIKDSTKQKLALALKCSQGDINNAIYDIHDLQPDPEENGASVMETIDKLEQMVEEDYPEQGAAGSKAEPAADAAKTNMEIMDTEEHRAAQTMPGVPEPVLKLKDKAIKRRADKLAEKQQMGKIKLRSAKKDPPPKEKWPEDPPEEIAVRKGGMMFTESEVDEICKKKVSEYREKLKNICLRTHANMPALNLTGETPAGMIGRALMAELAKEDAGVK